jgi:hypothetical protein
MRPALLFIIATILSRFDPGGPLRSQTSASAVFPVALRIAMRLIQLLPSKCQLHLLAVTPVSTNEALAPESRQYNRYIFIGGNANDGKPKGHKVAPPPLDLPNDRLVPVLGKYLILSSLKLTKPEVSSG